jgi:hypothetical protein
VWVGEHLELLLGYWHDPHSHLSVSNVGHISLATEENRILFLRLELCEVAANGLQVIAHALYRAEFELLRLGYLLAHSLECYTDPTVFDCFCLHSEQLSRKCFRLLHVCLFQLKYL